MYIRMNGRLLTNKLFCYIFIRRKPYLVKEIVFPKFIQITILFMS